jgi:arylsulfatase
METIDDEFLAATFEYLERKGNGNGRPFFLWFNPTRMHNFIHVKEEHRGKTGLGFYADAMVEHDALVGKLLDKLDTLGLTENTIVVYTTDNGPMVCLWPDAAMTPFRGEKNTGWEGAFRVPCLVRWPRMVKPGSTISELMASEDWLPTLAAAAGAPDIKEKLLHGHRAGERTYRVHLDGYDQRRLLSGDGPTARKEFFYFSDDGDLLAFRYDRVKIHFAVQRAKGIDVWREPFDVLRAPIFFDLKVDPFERGDEGIGYDRWWYERAFLAIPAQAIVSKFLATFRDFPPRQKPGSFTIDQALEAMSKSSPATR